MRLGTQSTKQMVLSGLLPIDSHLAIKALSDIALDTAVFNGHTTGADTLWTGTPLVSLSGEQMRSRAGASMAYSLGVTPFLVRSLGRKLGPAQGALFGQPLR